LDDALKTKLLLINRGFLRVWNLAVLVIRHALFVAVKRFLGLHCFEIVVELGTEFLANSCVSLHLLVLDVSVFQLVVEDVLETKHVQEVQQLKVSLVLNITRGPYKQSAHLLSVDFLSVGFQVNPVVYGNQVLLLVVEVNRILVSAVIDELALFLLLLERKIEVVQLLHDRFFILNLVDALHGLILAEQAEQPAPTKEVRKVY
jgi:hypothetical protein